MYCSKCGESNEENAKFCKKCGSKLEKNDKPTEIKKTSDKSKIIIMLKIYKCIIINILSFCFIKLAIKIFVPSINYVSRKKLIKNPFYVYSRKFFFVPNKF